jgi:molybdate transport system regulatory protein
MMMAKAEIDIRVRLMARGERAMGPGKADLLEHIVQLGSISASAKAMSMSYSRAWQLVDAMNKAFKSPLVEAETGGARGGGARVTPLGLEALALYRAMQAKLEAEAEAHLPALQKLLK